MRARQPSLQGGDQQNIFSDDTVIAFVRGSHLEMGCKAAGDERLLVIAGKSSTPRQLQLTTKDTALEGCGHYEPVYPANAPALQGSPTGAALTLPAHGFAVFRATR